MRDWLIFIFAIMSVYFFAVAATHEPAKADRVDRPENQLWLCDGHGNMIERIYEDPSDDTLKQALSGVTDWTATFEDQQETNEWTKPLAGEK